MKKQTIVYEHRWLLDTVQRMVSQASSEITRTDKLEHAIIDRLGDYLMKSKENVNHRRHLNYLIAREIKRAKERYGVQEAQFMSDLSRTNEEGQKVEYEPVDVLANVAERNLVTQETITLLAKDDRRVSFILNAWSQGYFDDTELSHILADVFSGQFTGHRSKIKRLRNICKAALTA